MHNLNTAEQHYLELGYLELLKGHCHKDFAVLGQFCAKIITIKALIIW